MSKEIMSSKSQYEYADWHLTMLKGIISALLCQGVITSETNDEILSHLSSVWSYANNAAQDLGHNKSLDTLTQED